MKKYLVVTIDTEPDCSPSWHYSDPLAFTGVSVGIAGRLHPLFGQYGVVPTYLINNVVLEDPGSVAVLRDLPGRYELGTHLHPEFIGPMKEVSDYAGKKGVANSCFYPPAVESEKIRNITELFERQFGYRPTAFRAGRYSAGPNTISSLIGQGYLVDTSVTPHVCWDDRTRERPVDFRDAPEQPYFIGREEVAGAFTITKPEAAGTGGLAGREGDAGMGSLVGAGGKAGRRNEGGPVGGKNGGGPVTEKNAGGADGGKNEGRLLEAPISIALKKRPFLRELIVSGAGLRHPMRKDKPYWLRPYYSGFGDMKALYEQYGSVYRDREALVLNMMFHNVEVMPGLSPYTKTEEECSEYLEGLGRFFAFCREEGFVFAGLSELHPVFRDLKKRGKV